MENQRVIEIITKYFRAAVGGDEQEVERMLKAIAGMIQEDSTKLVYFGDTVFLTMVRGKNFIEFQAMYDEDVDASYLIDDLNDYVEFIKTIEVKTLYTYGPKDFPYFQVIENSNFKFEKEEVEGQVAYYLKV